MKVKCFSVRVKALTYVTPKCAKVVGWDGSEALIPSSQIFGPDFDVHKSDAYWISAWILNQKNLQFSDKKAAIFDTETRQFLPIMTYEHHIPNKKQPIKNEPDQDLIR